MTDYVLDWDQTGADGSATFSSSTGGDDVGVSVSTPTNVNGDHFALSGGVLTSSSVCNETVTAVEFDAAVGNVSFEVFDVDAGSGWDDKVTIRAYDADGNLVDVNFSDLIAHHQVDGNSVEGGGNYAPGVEGSGAPDTVTVTIPGPITKLEIVHDDGDSTNVSGTIKISDISFDAAAPVGDGYVEGTNGDDIIDLAYTGDPDGDKIDNSDALLPGEAPEDDIVLAGEGDDLVKAGEGDDDVYAGGGDDTVYGEAGDDLIYGDSSGGLATGNTVRESFEWDKAPDPDSSGAIDNGDQLSGFSQNTGNVDVEFSVTSQSGASVTQFSADAQNVNDMVGDGAAIDDNSSLDNVLNGHGNTATYELDFSKDVENVSFNINDIDGDGVVKVYAYVNGERIEIDINAGDNLTLKDLDGHAGDETIDSNGGYEADTSENYSATVDIDGPVDKIVVVHSQDGSHNSGINITDVYFDVEDGSTDPGDDDLYGGDGDDTIHGEAGDDLITGGAGVDTMTGGDDRDTFNGANAGDFVDGGEGGDDHDTLDLSTSGPVKVDYDPGNPENGTVTFLDTDGNATGTMDFVNIENVILPPNSGPDANDDVAEVEEDGSVDIAVLANDTDPDADPLTVTSATADHGTVTINPDGTITYDPDENYNGPDEITYTVDDGNGGTDSAKVAVNVTPVNDDPVANDDVATTAFETAVDITPLLNDTDVEGDTLSILGTPTSDDGSVSVAPDGTVTFTPNTDFEGVAEIEYTVSDGNGGTDTGTIFVTVEDNPRDGIVQGTGGDDLIDVNYTGDPHGDMVDDLDEILPGEGPNDDIIKAGAGDDTILAGEGNDDIYAGEGDDEVEGGVGDDIIRGGDGSDTVDGGDGNDVIDTSGSDPASDYGFAPYVPQDTDMEDDRDSVDGGAGNDDIKTGDDRDTITGGSGDDTIDGGLDDDEITGDEGDDSIIGGHGADDIDGGAGNDTIWGGLGAGTDDLNIIDAYDPRPDNGLDTIHGGGGNDVIYGQDDDDVLYGDDGNDTIDGGIDEDTIFGGEGDDELIGGQGDDLIDGGAGSDDMSGGDDRDTFVNVGAGDVVDGNEGGDDYDTLDLSGSAPAGGSLEVTYDGSNPENGVVNFFDAGGNNTGSMEFFNIENVIPCFTPGTLIATPKGERRVEELQVGDRVITRDNGIQEIRWTGAKPIGWQELQANQHLKPILVTAGSLGNGLPERDMLVSPNHRVLVANDRTALYFDEREVLVPAKHLVDNKAIMPVELRGTTYLHFMFDNHEVVLSDGAWTESFQPGDYSLKGIGNAQRNEIFELFPELETAEGLEDFSAARRTLKKHEAALLK